MKKISLFLVLLFIVAVPLYAQMAPPKPLNDDLCAWMVGEWEGWSNSPMGKTKDWAKYEWGLDKQFVLTQYTGQTTEMTDDQKKKAMEMYSMSKEDVEKMMKMAYKGRGPITMNPATGEFMGYWFDNWRSVYKGTGKRDGNKLTMTWEGPMGTEVRTTEKVSNDKMVVTFKSTDPKGNVTEGKSELTRKKAAAK
jgi:hypothetical protein